MRAQSLKIITLSIALFACGDAPRPGVLPDAPTFDATPQFTLTVTKVGNGAGTVTSSVSGIACGDDCSQAYDAGTTVTLTATAATGATFLGWNGGDCAGTEPCTLTLGAVTTVTASFALDNTVVVTPAGNGSGTVTSDPPAIDCGATCSGTFGYGTTVTLTATPSMGSTFTGWSGGGCTGTGPCTTTVTQALGVTAQFTLRRFTLTIAKAGTGNGSVTSTPAGIDCGTSCAADFNFNQVVTLTATPATGSTFAGWSGGGCTGTGTCTTTIIAAVAVTPRFTLQQLTVTVTVAGNSGGTVTSDPPGIVCPTICVVPFNFNQTVTLTATAAPGSTFTGWSGGGCTGAGTCTLTIVAPISVTAMFTVQRFALTVTKAGNGAGTVLSTPAGINCGTTCAADFNFNQVVTLTATPATGSTFTGWTGGVCTGTGTCTTTITAATAVTATFTLRQFTVTVATAGNAGGTVISDPPGSGCGPGCLGPFNFGQMVRLTAVPAANSVFVGWSGGGCSGASTCTIVINSNVTVTATFTLREFPLTVAKAGNGVGTVTSSPAGINCGAICATNFGINQLVTLTATPATGSMFTGWSGGGCTGTSTCTMTITGGTAVTATFTLQRFTLTVTKAGNGAGTVTSNPTGITCGATCAADFNFNQSVTLTATPATGSTFAGWSGGGCTGTGTCTTTITAAATVTPTFTLQRFTLTVAKAGSGAGTVTSNPTGINCGATCAADFNFNQSVTLTATPATGSTFAGWSGGGCTGTGTCTTTVTAATTVTATFTLQRLTLTVTKAGNGAGTVTSNPTGINCGATCAADFNFNQSVTLTATPATGSTFAGWSGGGCTGTGTCTTTITAATTVTATFTLQRFTLTVAKAGNGAGTVTSNPTGISCGNTCAAAFNFNQSVTLTATPATGSTFTGWSGGGCTGTGTCTTTVTAATTVTATFTLQRLTLTVTKAGNGAGTVTSNPTGISCGNTCSAAFNFNQSVILTAAPSAGSTFTGWSGGGCTGTGTCTTTITAATTVTATFTLQRLTLTVTKAGNGAGTVTSNPTGISCGNTCSATFNFNQSVILTAAPSAGSTFAGWTGGGCTGTGTCTTTITAATSVRATFNVQQFTVSVTLVRITGGQGTVTSTPAGIDCGQTCDATFNAGTTVTLTPSTPPGNVLDGWSGDCQGTGPCVITLTGDVNVTATFRGT